MESVWQLGRISVGPQNVTFMGTFVPWDLPYKFARVLNQIKHIN
jgi:hypothetical protein